MLLRGIEGFGIKHRLQTERLLTLSEDLPLLALALDTEARIEAVLEDVRALSRARADHARARAPAERAGARPAEPSLGPDAVKLTIYLGRQERVGVARRPTSRWSTACTATGSPARACCSASTAPSHGVRRRATLLRRATRRCR